MAKAALASVHHFEQTADSRQRTAQKRFVGYYATVEYFRRGEIGC